MSQIHARQPVAAGERFPRSRAYPRYPVAARAEATEPISKMHTRGSVTVIGQGGCYFRTVETLATGAVLQVTIEWGGERFESWARAANSIAGDGTGLAFFDIEPSQLDLLKRWLDQLAALDRRRLYNTHL